MRSNISSKLITLSYSCSYCRSCRCYFTFVSSPWARIIKFQIHFTSCGSNILSNSSLQAVCDTLIARITDCVSSLRIFFFFAHIYFPASEQAAVTGVVPSPPRFLPSTFIAHRFQQSPCSSISHRVLLTHALALSASQFVHKNKSQRIYTSMHSAGLALTKLTYISLEDNLIRHRGDRIISQPGKISTSGGRVWFTQS